MTIHSDHVQGIALLQLDRRYSRVVKEHHAKSSYASQEVQRFYSGIFAGYGWINYVQNLSLTWLWPFLILLLFVREAVVLYIVNVI